MNQCWLQTEYWRSIHNVNNLAGVPKATKGYFNSKELRVERSYLIANYVFASTSIVLHSIFVPFSDCVLPMSCMSNLSTCMPLPFHCYNSDYLFPYVYSLLQLPPPPFPLPPPKEKIKKINNNLKKCRGHTSLLCAGKPKEEFLGFFFFLLRTYMLCKHKHIGRRLSGMIMWHM